VIGFLMLIATFLRNWRSQPSVDSDNPVVAIIKWILDKLDKGQITAIVIIALGAAVAAFGNDTQFLGDLLRGQSGSSEEPSPS
jgi:hypothetical protein